VEFVLAPEDAGYPPSAEYEVGVGLEDTIGTMAEADSAERGTPIADTGI
jgi:hypothetical protein